MMLLQTLHLQVMYGMMRQPWRRSRRRSENSEMVKRQVQMRSLQSFWKLQRYRLALLSMNYYFCSYGSPERFLQTGKRPWSYHFIREKDCELFAVITDRSHCCQYQARSSPTYFWNACSPSWPVNGRPQQSGFTRSHSTIDAILALRLVVELQTEFGKPLQVAYIDIKAAFDSVDRRLCGKRFTPPELHNSWSSWSKTFTCTGTTSWVRVKRKLSKAFYTSSGVRQGCVLAPALFCLAIDWIIHVQKLQQSQHYTWWYSVHRPRLCWWCCTFYTRLRKVAFRWSSNHHGPAHFMGKDQTTEHWSRSPSSISLRRRTSCGSHGPVCLSGQHCWLDWLLLYRRPTTSWSHIFGDGSARPSLASEPAESCYEAEDLHYMCPGSKPSQCRNLDCSAGIPHDVPKTHSWHSMEWLHHQQGCIWQHEPPKYSQHHSRSPLLHLRSHPSPTRPHASTYDSEARREYQIRRLRTLCWWRMGCCWRSVYMEGATTYSRLRAAVSEWVKYSRRRLPRYAGKAAENHLSACELLIQQVLLPYTDHSHILAA